MPVKGIFVFKPLDNLTFVSVFFDWAVKGVGDNRISIQINYAAERALRRGVIWRRRSDHTQSDHGSQFVERILTAVMTLRQQNRDVLDYLAAACRAANLGNLAPSLLPVD
jgi:hypothetical protein